jgi:hypothetical protein
MKSAIQFSLRRYLVSTTLVAIAVAMLVLLNKIAYIPGAEVTLGEGARFAGELGFCMWVGSSLCFGVAFGLLFKHRRAAIVAGSSIALIALICIANCYP